MATSPSTSDGRGGGPGKHHDSHRAGEHVHDAPTDSHADMHSTPATGDSHQQPSAAHAHGGSARPPAFERANIPGWGADLARQDRPAVPMERMPARLPGGPVAAPEPQRADVEVLHSIERPGLTPLYGTTCPPTGLSGAIRRMAFRRSENDLRHWLLLLLADRVNVVEAIGQDLARGKVPNVLAEMGIRSEWRYNRAGLARKIAVTGAVMGLGWYLLRRRRPDEPRQL